MGHIRFHSDAFRDSYPRSFCIVDRIQHSVQKVCANNLRSVEAVMVQHLPK